MFSSTPPPLLLPFHASSSTSTSIFPISPSTSYSQPLPLSSTTMGFLPFAFLWSSPVSHLTRPLSTRTAHPFNEQRPVQQHVTLDLTTQYPPKQRQSTCTTTSSSTPKRSKLPIELVFHILEAAYFDDDLEPDTRLLVNCSLVCKGWVESAQRLLFRNVIIRSQASFYAFRDTVNRSTARGRTLGDAVARLRIVLDQNHPDKISYDDFAETMLLCPNLYELDLSLYGYGKPRVTALGALDSSDTLRTAPLFAEETLNKLRSGPTISSFRFSNWSDNDEITCQLLDIWPSVSVLALRGRPPRAPLPSSDSTSTLLPYRGTLREAHLSFQNAPKLEFMKWLLHGSTQSLRVLELERMPTAPQLLEFLVQEYGASLQSLSLPACNSHDQAAAVLQCAQLKEFKVENPWASPSLLRKLPRSLEHIAFGVDKDTPLHVITETIKSRDEVKAVTAHLWDGEEAQGMLSGLRKVCTSKGIELVCTTNIRRFRSIVVCTNRLSL